MSATLGKLDSGEALAVNVDSLVETRMLIQATSGGGKSWALRRLLEQTAKGVQQLVIDPEGEFQTLREKFDFVICAPHDADAIASPQTAGLLARRLLESGVSAILDIYDLKAHERQAFVQRFLESLLNAPKTLWHPVLIVLDEAHVFAPQAGGAEALGSVIDVATRGRKRGQCLVAATQRLSKLHKDVAAELMNKLIGRTGLDVDVKRAAEELGMTPQAATAALRQLDPGDFYCFGPALSRTVQKMTSGPVETTHPKTGQRLMKAPPAPSKRILQTLAKLADLPTQAADEVKGLADAKAVISRLERENAKLKGSGADPEAITKAVEAATMPLKRSLQIAKNRFEHLKERIAAIAVISNSANVQRDLDALPQPEAIGVDLAGDRPSTSVVATVKNGPPLEVVKLEAGPRLRPAESNGDAKISGPMQKVLNALAWWEQIGKSNPTNGQIGFVAGYSGTGGSFKEYLGRCHRAALISRDSGTCRLTDLGRGFAQSESASPSLEEFHDRILNVVKDGPLVKILRAVISYNGREIASEEIGRLTGYEATGGSFKEYLGRVKRLGFVDRRNGMIYPTELLFPKGLA